MSLAENRYLKRIAELEEANAQLRRRIRVLERVLDDETVDWSRLPRLSRSERAIVSLLMRRGQVTHEQLYAWLYSERHHEQPTPETVKVLICKLRKRLAPAGIAIRTIWGIGVEMPAESRALINQALSQSVAAA